MIYDSFTFFNELDLLEIRLNVLSDVIDRFVLVEAGETHTGKGKPFFYHENLDRFKKFENRIVCVRIDRFPEGLGPWERECFQRNAILKGLTDASDDDVILISDLDEIPRPELVAKYSKLRGVWTFNMRSFGFYLNWEDVRCHNMCGTKMLTLRDLKTAFSGDQTVYDEFLPESVNQGNTVSKLRRRPFPASKGGETILRNSGWHFTCLGGAAAVVTKMRAVAPHHGFDPDDPDLTEKKVNELLAKGQGPALKMNCFAVPIDESFPAYLIENVGLYKHLIFNETAEYRRNIRLPRMVRTVQGRLIQIIERMIPRTVHRWLHAVRIRLT